MAEPRKHWIEFVKDGYAKVGVGWLKEDERGKRISIKIENANDLPTDESGNANLTMFRNDKVEGNQPTHRISCKIPDGYVPASHWNKPAVPAPRQPPSVPPKSGATPSRAASADEGGW